MGRKTPPWPDWPAWTTARHWTFIRSNIRKMWMKWPPQLELKKEGRRTLTKEEQKERGVRHKFENTCVVCKEWFQDKFLEIDHITPTGSLKSYKEAGEFIEKLLVGKDKLRRVCKPCHREITNKQRGHKQGETK